MHAWDSIYNKTTGLSIPEVVGLVMIAIPGYILYKDCLKTPLKYKIHELNKIHPDICQEEEIIEAKIRSESLRPGPPFLDSHQYHTRRMERAKSAYSSAWSLVNQNLDLGNKSFKVAVTENDKNILNVVRKLLIDELDIDGYRAVINTYSMDKWSRSDFPTSETDNESKYDFYFDITVA